MKNESYLISFYNILVYLICWQFHDHFLLLLQTKFKVGYFNMVILLALFSICVDYSQYNYSLSNFIACKILLCMSLRAILTDRYFYYYYYA